jgi:hypothetical protein
LSSSLTELFPNRGADRVVREVDVDVVRRDFVKDICFFSVDTDNCTSVVDVKPRRYLYPPADTGLLQVPVGGLIVVLHDRRVRRKMEG